jgi:hypothetical protein
MGKTYWHGPIVTRQDSYGVEVAFRPPPFDEEAWERTAAWESKKGQLSREASELLLQAGCSFDRKGMLSVDVVHSAPKQAISDEDFAVVLAIVVSMIVRR